MRTAQIVTAQQHSEQRVRQGQDLKRAAAVDKAQEDEAKRQRQTRELAETSARLAQYRQRITSATTTAYLDVLLRAEPTLAPEINARRRQLEEIFRRQAEARTASQPFSPGQDLEDCWTESTIRVCGPKLVVVPAGSFSMGTSIGEAGWNSEERPQHTVNIAKPFAAGKFEVTVALFRAFADASQREIPNACLELTGFGSGLRRVARHGWSFRSPGYQQTPPHPVVCVNWHDAQAYVLWLSQKTGKTYRMLSEAEWEYVARAGSSGPYAFGADEKRLCEFGNVADELFPAQLSARPLVGCRDGHERTAPVGSFAANAFGLHDTIGNVWEWVADCWNPTYTGAPTDGSAWSTGDCTKRSARGGSWGSNAPTVRSAQRSSWSIDERNYVVGFRVARDLTP